MNILIIDDHPLFIDGISHLFHRLEADCQVIKATSAQEAIKQLESGIDFDLILLDLCMPSMNGLALLQRFKADELCMPVVIVSSEEQAGLIQKALSWGAMGFIPKAYSANDMLGAIEQVLEGEIHIPQHVQTMLARLPPRNVRSEMESPRYREAGISSKQYEVLKLLAQGYSNEQIASILNRTENTVKSHVSVVLQTFGASNRTEAVRIAQEKGVLKPGYSA